MKENLSETLEGKVKTQSDSEIYIIWVRCLNVLHLVLYAYIYARARAHTHTRQCLRHRELPKESFQGRNI
jgi:hypothetical protein